MIRLSFILVCLAFGLAGCEAPPPLKAKKSEFRPMSSETKQSINDQTKDAQDAAKDTTFGNKH